MKRMLIAAKENVVYNKLAYLYVVLFSVDAAGTAIVASFMNVEWEQLSPTTKFLTVIIVLKAIASAMLAFLNKTMARLQDGKPLIAVTETTETVTTKPSET